MAVEAWSSSQGICGLLRAPETTRDRARAFLKSVDGLFSENRIVRDQRRVSYGWLDHPDHIITEAEPALWTSAAVARALGRPGLLTAAERKVYLRRLNEVQRACEVYRPDDSGGWHMFPNQKRPQEYSTYASTLALLALLETRTAKLPWLGSEQKRDRHLESTARWIIAHYRRYAGVTGWSGTVDPDDPNCDGLTLQIYAELLRAESEVGIVLPEATVVNSHPSALATISLNPWATALRFAAWSAFSP